MSFQPFLNQLIADPQHNYLLPNALTLAALGATDSQIRKCRSKLEQGKHFLYAVGDDTRRRLFYTYQGLLELSLLLGTDRAKAFRSALLAVASGAAIVHRPAGHIVPPVRYTEPENNIQQSTSHQVDSVSQQPETARGLHPDFLRELASLKRDEIELQRSQEETRRLTLLRDALRPQLPSPIERQKRKSPTLVVVQSNQTKVSALRDDPLAVTLVLASFIFLCSIILVSFSVVLGESNARETQINVR